ncbi:hypothetical protein A3F62_04905 [Candidatus Woesebacteria bacterium RIFCSPHIGHO2_12_FULL_44_11]|uniref:Recombinase family protein n=1 Tax=Candidatus Woesebacteria bacterium RIFCSPLOWO2_01_FULL_44_14 TaxID=1802525 RepID=A0A1F8C3K4_9BACT|nr:MAG: hypothetical protein A3F62_04905 [Candidatus Woesebacteria bacterium RIFCSPHIGHO2_12_FULL_44_11]OGM70864.1 MAG: hypothetical protein A2975_01145 [Candidatus Woesebacteria bacterium RIFCSPLOWO2_01_FULL_44_14]
MEEIKKVAAYCRVSTDRQKEEQTIEVQKRFIREWAEKNNAVITDWYLDDGWSGDLIARPELDRLREDVNKGIWEAIVFIDRDRLARNLPYQEYVIKELLEKDIKPIFINNPLADDAQTRVLQQFYGIVAEMERINIAERMRKGKIHKAKSGKLVGHTAPYGYRYIPKVGEIEGHFEVYEPEAEIVRMIFHWVADEGYSMRGVVRELYKRKIPSAKGKTRWVKSSVERLLNREDYIGTSYYNRRMAVVPKHPQKVNGYKKIKKSSRKLRPKEEWIAIPVLAIIDKELFEKTHKRLQENQIYNWRNKKYDYLLVNKIFCNCGYRRIGDGVKDHHYYRCTQKIYKFPYTDKCIYKSGVNAEILDTVVWNKLVSLIAEKQLIKQQAERWKAKLDKTTTKSFGSQDRLKIALEKLGDEEKRLLQAYTTNLINFEGFKKSAEEIKAKKELLQSEIIKLESRIPDEEVSLDSFEDICESMFYALKYADAAKKREYIKNLIVSIYVGERRKALVNGRIPLIAQGQNIQDVLISRDCGVS